MEIIGQLIELTNVRKLPIPWYSRGHLGLETGSSASVGFTKARTGLVPDIIVAPYSLQDLENIYFITITGKDETGFISKVQNDFQPHNIILSESVTTEERENHRINITFEIISGLGATSSILKDFIDVLAENFGSERVKVIDPPFELKEGYHYVFDYDVKRGQIDIGDWQS